MQIEARILKQLNGGGQGMLVAISKLQFDQFTLMFISLEPKINIALFLFGRRWQQTRCSRNSIDPVRPAVFHNALLKPDFATLDVLIDCGTPPPVLTTASQRATPVLGDSIDHGLDKLNRPIV